ncbi:FAD binding domain-containing protein [Candidatus Zixiibacteriota bacterium]
MIIPEFTYHRPTTLAEACELGRSLGDQACYLAGGTDLFVDLKQKRRTTGHVISLANLPGLDTITIDNGSLRIGAMTRLTGVARSEEVKLAYPALSEAVSAIGSEQIRNQGTIGGNFCGAVPCADSPPICIAGDAMLKISDGTGERIMAAGEFISSPRVHTLKPGEVLLEVTIPAQPDHSGASYQRFSLRHGSALAVASVAARLTVEDGKIGDARVVLGAVAPVPLTAAGCAGELIGQVPSDDIFRKAAAVAASEASPLTDIRGSEEFRRNIVEVLTIRALHEALERAGGVVL